MDFVKALMDGVSNNSINLISQKTGENTEKTKAGLFAVVPAVLAGIMKNAATGGAGFLNNLIPGFSADKTASLPDPDLQDGESLMTRGQSMLGNLFGNDTSTVSNAVSDSAGISREKSSGLLAMAVPVIMAGITRMMSSKGWGISDLVRNLFESKSEISSALPGNLGSTLGLASLTTPDLGSFGSMASGIPGSASAGTHSYQSGTKVPPLRTTEIERPVSTGMGFLKWLIPLIILALVAWWLLGRKGGNENANVATTTDTMTTEADTSSMASAATGAATGSLNAAGDWVYDLGSTIQVKLPNGTEISVGENSVENRLLSFIKDDSRAVDKTTWFSLDRLYFETGKSTLKEGSRQQLENIAAIMKAYPKVKIKLGGYTDNTGDAAVNKRLSTARAETAMKDLSSLGISADRLEAEGYGAEHPVASNDTKEGRAQNRRIDIRVTAK